MSKDERIKWATAIAQRISDEWVGKDSFPEDARYLETYLKKTLSKDANAIKQFIGSGFIESDYFSQLSY
jgi:hypothetical protein